MLKNSEKNTTIKLRKDFDRIYKTGFKTDNFHCVQNNLQILRYAISVRKKEGCAVIRNRIKRRIRVILNQVELPGYDLIIKGKKEMCSQNFQDLKKQILEYIDMITLITYNK